MHIFDKIFKFQILIVQAGKTNDIKISVKNERSSLTAIVK